MKSFAPIAVAAFILFGSTAHAQEQQQVSEAKAAASTWLVLVDAGQYADTYTQASSTFHVAVSQEEWVKTITPVRAPLGPVASRKLKSAEFTHTLPNAPDGDYVVLQYETTFAGNRSGIETLIPMRDKDGSWKVSGYFIR